MSQKNGFYGWNLVGVLWLIYLINIGFVFYGSNVINTLMVQELGMSRKTLGAGFALFHLMQSGFSAPLIAFMINKKGVRFTLAFGSALTVAGAMAMATFVSSTVLFLSVFGIIIGFGVGFGGVLSVQTGITFWFEKKRALAMSIALTAAGVGGFIAAPILNTLISSAGDNWRVAWFFIAGLCSIATLVSLLFVKNRPSELGQFPDGESATSKSAEDNEAKLGHVYRTSREWTTREALKTTSLWLIFIAILGFLVPYLFCVAHGVIYLIDSGFPRSLAAVSLGLLTLFSIIGRLIGGALGDHIEPRYMWGIALLVMAGGVLSCMFAKSPVFVYLYTIFVGIGFGASFIMMPTVIGNYFGMSAFASIIGVLAPLFTIFSSSFPFVAGVIRDLTGSYSIAFAGAFIFCIVGAVAIIAVRPHSESDVKTKPA
jgi:MFS family permease